VGAAYSFVPTAADADGDTLTFSVTGTPSWATLNVTTGELSGTPTNLDAGRHGPITISVSDGTDSTSLAAFSIDVPAPFELLSGEPGTGVIGDVELAFMGNGNTWLSGIAANPATGAYAVAWEAWGDDAFTSSTPTVKVHDGAAWLGEVAVETSDERLNAFIADGSAAYLLAASDTAFGIAWVQEDGSGSGFAHAHYATFDGTGWAGTQLEGQAGADDDALIASDGDTFTVFWRQADPAGHPAVQLPFVYDGLP
jgi:hypothetical protein